MAYEGHQGGWAAPPNQQVYHQGHQQSNGVQNQSSTRVVYDNAPITSQQQPQQQMQQQQQQYYHSGGHGQYPGNSAPAPSYNRQIQTHHQTQSVVSNTSRNSDVMPGPGPRGGIISTAADEEFEDGRIRNAEAATKIRDAWIYTQISARAKEFTQYRNVS